MNHSIEYVRGSGERVSLLIASRHPGEWRYTPVVDGYAGESSEPYDSYPACLAAAKGYRAVDLSHDRALQASLPDTPADNGASDLVRWAEQNARSCAGDDSAAFVAGNESVWFEVAKRFRGAAA